jgi:hypothetical protein
LEIAPEPLQPLALHQNHRGKLDSKTTKTIIGLLIFAILSAIYTFTYSGVPRVEDEQLIAARAQSLVLWEELSFPQLYGNDRIRHLASVQLSDADFNAAIEPGQSIIAASLYRLAPVLRAGGTQAGLTTNLYLTALTGVIVYLILLSMGFRTETAIVGALSFGLGTMAWPFSKTLYRDVLLMFCGAIVVLGLSISQNEERVKGYAGLALMLFGLIGGILAKRTAWVMAPALVIAIILAWKSSPRSNRTQGRIVAAVFLCGFALIVAAIAIPSRGLLARYSANHFIFVLARIFEGIGPSTLPAILGPFFSPGKSIFLFSPILILAPIGLARGWPEHKPVYTFIIVTILLLVVAQALFYRELWAGIPVWGLRFMLLAMPMMVILCAPIIDLAFTFNKRCQKWSLLCLLGASMLVQLAGVAILWHIPLLVWHRMGWDPYQPSAVWKLANSPLPIHFTALLNPANFDMAWFRVLGNNLVSICIPVITVLIVGGSGAFLYWILQRRRGNPRHLLLAFVICVMALVFPIFPSLGLNKHDPAAGGDRPEFDVMLSWIEPHIQPGDLVIVDSYGTPLWHYMMNHWQSSVPWYSLPYEIPGTADVPGNPGASPSSAFLNLIEARETLSERLWYLQTNDAPDFDLQRETQYLNQHFTRIQAIHFTGFKNVEIHLYLLDR